MTTMMIDLPSRLTIKVEPEPNSGCWLWIASSATNGYGRAYDPVRKRDAAAHRVVYETVRGPIPAGMDLDHLCRVRRCVNPSHLEPVSRRENLLRGETVTRRNADVAHCPARHPYSEENTYYRANGDRKCRTCVLDQQRQAYERKYGRAYRFGHRRRRLKRGRRREANETLTTDPGKGMLNLDNKGGRP